VPSSARSNHFHRYKPRLNDCLQPTNTGGTGYDGLRNGHLNSSVVWLASRARELTSCNHLSDRNTSRSREAALDGVELNGRESTAHTAGSRCAEDGGDRQERAVPTP
jgi:hypothetical protein